MKIKPMFTVFTLKSLLVISFVTIGSGGFTKCEAQSIVGKWQGVSVRNYYSADYAKETGKQVIEQTAKETGNSTIEFKSDHSFIMTFSAVNDTAVTTMKGIWDLTADQLKITLEPAYNPQKKTTTATISITGNTMVMTAVMPPPSRIIKTISISTRI